MWGVGWGVVGGVGVVASGVKSTSKFVPNVSKFIFDQREKKKQLLGMSH